MTKMGSARGFTLIEVLVVIAIIAIVAAIVFPVFSQAKESGKQDACLSNLHQLSTATTLYADGDDDVFPPAQTEGQTVLYWGDLIQPYARSLGILDCPAEPAHLRSGPPAEGFLHGVTEPWSYCYAINDVKADDDSSIGAAGAPGSTLTRPSETVLLVDGWPLPSDPGSQGESSRHVVDWVWGERDSVHHPLDDGDPVHHERFNLLACDGHIKSRQRHRQGDGTFVPATWDVEWIREK